MLKLIKSTFYNEQKTKNELVNFINQADILSFSNQCQSFENNFASYQGRKDMVFVNSGSSANLAIIQALLNLGKIKNGDQVGFSAVTWSTNVMPLIQLGLKPIPIDVELDTLNISSRTLKECLAKTDIKMLFLTNLLGFCDDIDSVAEICKEQNIILIEDNCESLGTVYKGKKLGNFGLAGTFSFYVGHHMSTIEGGAVVTDDDDLATMLRVVRAHGWDRNLAESEQDKIRMKYNINSQFYSRYTFYDLGYNLRPTEINGWLGNNQLQYIDEINEKRQSNFLNLIKDINNNDSYYAVRYDHIDFLSNFAVPIVCRSQNVRDELVEKCAEKVEIRPIVGGQMVEQPFFTKYYPDLGRLFPTPNAEIVHQSGLYFGNNPELTETDMEVLREIFA